MNAFKNWGSFLSFFICMILVAGQAHGSLLITSSGTGTGGEEISASALFEIGDTITHDFGSGAVPALMITITNTSPTTSYRGNLITGLFWSMSGVGSLNTNIDGLAPTVRTTNTTNIYNVDIAPAVNNTPTDGSFVLSNGPFGTANSGLSYSMYSYGLSTVGYGLTGFSGSATNGDTYGIAAPGSNLTLDGLKNAFPIIDTSATFWIAKPAELTSLSQVTNAAFAFGSLPDNRITYNNVPIPPTVWIFGSALLGLIGIRRKI
jgi:hypothetical protein